MSFIIYIALFLSFCHLIQSQIVFPKEDNSRLSSQPVLTNGPNQANRKPTRRRNQNVKKNDCSTNLECVPFSECSYFDLKSVEKFSCTINRGPGICCPKKGYFRPSNETVSIRLPSDFGERLFAVTINLRPLTQRIFESARRFGLNFVKDLEAMELVLINRGLVAQLGSSEKSHQDFFGNNPATNKISQDGQVLHQATLEIAKELNITNSKKTLGLRKFNFKSSALQDRCPPEPRCQESKYRSPDGSCNNLNKPRWGKSLTPFGRLMPPQYEDGIDRPRVSKSGRTLPNSRVLSGIISTDFNNPHERYTLLLMQFGQFLDHDMTLTASTRLENGDGLVCCGRDFFENPSLLHPACFSIPVPPQDLFYNQFNFNCMTFVRSAPAPRPDCQLGPREQLNQLTSFIDGGMIYGSTVNEMRRLRSFQAGQLVTTFVNNEEYLPFTNDSCAIPQRAQRRCFAAGDSRANEQLELAAMHTIWLREHNRVARILRELNPRWNDELLYQEARRIVIAEIQQIVYNEFLPIILGKRVVEFFDLYPQKSGYSAGYDILTDPSIISSFSTAAFRFHTLIQGSIEFRDNNNRVFHRVDLSETFNNPSLLYERRAVDGLVNGLSGQPIQNADKFFTEQVTHHLFRQPGKRFGIDLVALNIQRGRDHGIPDYNSWREACGGNKIKNFQDLAKVMSPKDARTLSQLYESVDDIDLFLGGVLENKLEGALVGETFACIIGEQFRRLKFGDRFWYENGGLISSFSEAQLQEIRKVSMARILCDNAFNVNVMQPLAFVLPFEWNRKTDCKGPMISSMDLRQWQNEPVGF